MKIALVGYSRSGKDTVGKMFREYIGMARQVSFGHELKARFHDAFPEVPAEPKPRELYEKFGKLARDIDPDFWVKCADDYIKFWEGFGYHNFTLTDLRQENEEAWARKNGFILIEVWSPLGQRKARSVGDTNFEYVNNSEKYLHRIACDYTIYNTKDLDFLKKQVQYVMELIEGDVTK